MDARLMHFGPYEGKQVTNLTLDDVPIVSFALCSIILGQGGAGADALEPRNHVAMVHLRGTGFDLYIRGEDWLKIAPYLVDGTFNPYATPTTPIAMAARPFLSAPEIAASDLYRRVSGILTALFPTPIPTSNY